MSRSLAAYTAVRQVFFTCAVLSLFSLSSLAQTSDLDLTTQPANAPNNPRGSETSRYEAGSVEASAPGMRDKLFLREATTSGMLEIQLSQLALRKASGEDVKKFATSLIADHIQISESLQSAAEAQGVMLPTKLSSREETVYERLNALSGQDFDREYIKTLSEDHHRDLRNFRSEAAMTQDTGLRSAVQNATTTIHQHMIVADQIARTKGVQVSRSTRVATSSHQY